MTAEIAVMNKMAVALAADSAVTIRHPLGQKIYNTVNKLFMLSDIHPIGVMTYGNAELMGVPWELIVKLYRRSLGSRCFGTIDEYADDLLADIVRNQDLFPTDLQEEYVYTTTRNGFLMVREILDKQIQAKIEANGEVLDTAIRAALIDVVTQVRDRLARVEDACAGGDSTRASLSRRFRGRIRSAITEVFEKHTIDTTIRSRLYDIATLLLTKTGEWSDDTGIVVAGYGDTQVFPAVVRLSVRAVLDGEPLVCRRSTTSINHGNTAAVMPFAEMEMVHTFMEGLDPGLLTQYERWIAEVLGKYPEMVSTAMPELSPTMKQALQDGLADVGKLLIQDLKDKMTAYRHKHHVAPIVNVVAVLPKDELASMAESFVNLTSLKRRISTDAETVGGPIDVAVISKGDGFVWIRRKHYFAAELNPRFMASYYRPGNSNTEAYHEDQP
jgi:hypothetical protein